MKEKECGLGDEVVDEEQEEVLNFEQIGLDPRLIRALSKKNVQKPTPIQGVAIPLILVSLWLQTLLKLVFLGRIRGA